MRDTKITLILVAVFLVGLTFPALAYDFGPVDLGGRTVTFVGWHDYLSPFREGGDYEGRLEEAERLFNVKINLVTPGWDDYEETLMTRLVSGDSQDDIWLMTHTWFWSLMPRDAFFPVNTVIKEEYFQSLSPSHQAVIETLSYRGRKYGFSHFGNILGTMRFMGVNRDLLDRLGMPDVYQLYNDGDWTWEVATEIALAATQDFDGDGEPDQWGISTPWIEGYVLANDGWPVQEIDGRMVYTYDQAPALNALQQLYEWEHVHRVQFNGDWGGDQFAAGRVAMQPLEYWRFDFIGPAMEDRYAIVPKPKGPDAADYRFPQLQLETIVLPANATDPIGKVALVDWLFRAEDYDAWFETSADGAPDRQAAAVVRRGLTTWGGQMFGLSGVIGSITGPARNAAIAGEKTPAAAMAEVKQAAQAALDELFNN